jgi:glyoxylase-like metal-dependent hydrolase (beta-lactamase superfamily II)
MKLGAFDFHLLSDGFFALDGGQMFGVVPKTLWEKKMPADSRNRIRLGLNCVFVDTGSHKVMIETGIGDKLDARFADIYAIDHSALLPAELEKRGIGLADVDVVINSHLHFDHCGWNTRREGVRLVPTFPRASYFIQQGEWEHALNPTERDRASYIEEFFAAAESQTEFLQGDGEVVPGVRVEVTPGHTRHLQIVWIESQGERACFLSDVVPTQAHLPYPWIMAFDLYPLETLASKKRLLPRLAAEDVLVVFPHDPQVPCARLAERDGKIVVRGVAP